MKRVYSAQELQTAQQEMQAYAAQRQGGGARIGSGGRLARQIHPTAMRNAIQQNGIGVLKDREYWADMERMHPEISVPFDGDNSVGGAGIRTAPKTRFGRVKTRVRWVNGQRIEENFS